MKWLHAYNDLTDWMDQLEQNSYHSDGTLDTKVKYNLEMIRSEITSYLYALFYLIYLEDKNKTDSHLIDDSILAIRSIEKNQNTLLTLIETSPITDLRSKLVDVLYKKSREFFPTEVHYTTGYSLEKFLFRFILDGLKN